MKRNKLALLGVAYVATLLLFAWAGYNSLADYDLSVAQHKAASTVRFQTDMTYYDLPRITVNLSPQGNGQIGTVRMDITLEIENQYVDKIVGAQPRITDRLVRYTKNLDYDELLQPHSAAALKPDMLFEINKASAPIPVKDMVFKGFMVL